jgi:hypothetical protein
MTMTFYDRSGDVLLVDQITYAPAVANDDDGPAAATAQAHDAERGPRIQNSSSTTPPGRGATCAEYHAAEAGRTFVQA